MGYVRIYSNVILHIFAGDSVQGSSREMTFGTTFSPV
jgi:hypothetical protein